MTAGVVDKVVEQVVEGIIVAAEGAAMTEVVAADRRAAIVAGVMGDATADASSVVTASVSCPSRHPDSGRPSFRSSRRCMCW